MICDLCCKVFGMGEHATFADTPSGGEVTICDGCMGGLSQGKRLPVIVGRMVPEFGGTGITDQDVLEALS